MKKELKSLISDTDGKLSAKRILVVICISLLTSFAIVALSADHKIINEKLALQIEEHIFYIIGVAVLGIAFNFKDYFLSKKGEPIDTTAEEK